MSCAAIAAIVGAVTIPLGDVQYPDTLTIAPHPDFAAQVCYFNNPSEQTVSGTYHLVLPPSGPTVRVFVLAATDETVTVTPDAQHSLFPAGADTQTAPDGEARTFFVIGGLM